MGEGPMHAHNRQAARDQSRYQAELPAKERHNQPPPEKDFCDPFLQIIAKDHFDHEYWKQIGRCVYCSCGVRMFQGSLKNVLELASAASIQVIE